MQLYFEHSINVWLYGPFSYSMCPTYYPEHTTSHVLCLRHQSQLLSKHQGEKTKKSKEAIR